VERPTSSSSNDVFLSESWEHASATDYELGGQPSIPELETPGSEDDDMEMADITFVSASSHKE